MKGNPKINFFGNMKTLPLKSAVAQRCSVKEDILRYFGKFTGKHLCQKRQHKFFPVNLSKFLIEHFFLQNTSGGCFCCIEILTETCVQLVIFMKLLQKHPPRGVLTKRCSENMQQIYRRKPIPKCGFNKDALQLH